MSELLALRRLALHRMQRATTESRSAYRRLKQATTILDIDRCNEEFMAALKKWDTAHAELIAANDAIAAIGRPGLESAG